MSRHHPPRRIGAADGVGTQQTFRAPPGAAPSRRSRRRSALSVALAIVAASLTALAPGVASAAAPGEFAGWAAGPGVQTVDGDFNGDGFGDVALVGGSGWTTIPVAFGTGGGKFQVTNSWVPDIPGWAQASGAKPVAGDYNKDGRTDIALVGGSGWTTIPVAYSYGNGTFNVTNSWVPSVPGWAQASGAKPVAGDYNKDGFGDIALVGGPGWTTIPVAYSYGNGSFSVTNSPVPDIPGWAQASGAKPVAGDYNKDGFGDIALVGGPGWTTIPVAYSYGNGSFSVTNSWVADIPGWAQAAGAKPVAGDYNKDGFGDIALVGGPNWTTIPVAYSYGNGTFNVTNSWVPSVPGWAQASGAKPVAGDYNKDGFGDIALVGGPGWNTVPIAHSYGNGSFLVTNQMVG